MNKMTIGSAIISILKDANQALTTKQIYERMEKNNSYEFKTKNPMGIISNELRRHCEGSRLSEGRQIKFKKSSQGFYTLV